MNRLWLLLLLAPAPLPAAESPSRDAGTVVLDATAVRNLRIQTVVAEPGEFEETVFALGRIEAQPGRVAAVTSRISGRVVELAALPGDRVAAQQTVIKVESRQAGGSAPVIALPAPMAGWVTQLAVRLGDPVEPDRALLEISDLTEVLAVARVPEHAVGRIPKDATASIQVAAWPEKRWQGRLLRLGTAVDADSGTLDAVFLLPNPDTQIRPGMRAEFSIVVERRSDVVQVPRSALQGDPAGRFVYVKDFDLPHAFLKTPVVVGRSNDRFVEIVSGLLPADEVVTQGAYSLAFAGGGTLSLKEALDAAHGHAHAEDGSELTPDKKAAAGTPAGRDHDHGNASDPDDHDHHASASRFWMGVSGVLFVLLLAVAFWKNPRPTPQSSASAPSPREDS